jgi:hypothetical protein
LGNGRKGACVLKSFASESNAHGDTTCTQRQRRHALHVDGPLVKAVQALRKVVIRKNQTALDPTQVADIAANKLRHLGEGQSTRLSSFAEGHDVPGGAEVEDKATVGLDQRGYALTSNLTFHPTELDG